MKSKRVLTMLMMMVFATVIFAGCSSNSSDDEKEKEANGGEITLKVATYFANTAPAHTNGVEPWMNRVEELTDGKVKFDLYPGEQLGKMGDILGLTKSGVTDIGIFEVSSVTDDMPLTNVLGATPGIYETSSQGTLGYNELVQENEDLMKIDYTDNGVHPLYTWVCPPTEIFTREKEIRVPADLKGIKIRTAGLENNVYESLGATPVSIPYPEMYESVERGVVEGVNNMGIGVQTAGITELLGYVNEQHMGGAILPLVINEKVWASLPEDVQDAMSQASQEVAEQIGDTYNALTEEFNKEFATAGTFVELSEEEQAEWTTLMEEYQEEWLKKNESKEPAVRDVFNAYLEKLEKYQ
ncbi:TRAP transporter substrate-binding protein DctP [Pseudogracilibacillus auburnensis]|uniref:TRAP transporter substrate-binding protein DctP n=1 Tax=Pseudogracilibacillus auburnensis TaxID=1494959 RepID=UPI001A961693|nr:TRAP transporter substrate-binding protein DctP [Pseudogracilibacillus auburnensis]MBO1003246.1 TRAP transporter substrate-binding protein DctP [Pseudogracilibacillus auburnensis]